MFPDPATVRYADSSISDTSLLMARLKRKHLSYAIFRTQRTFPALQSRFPADQELLELQSRGRFRSDNSDKGALARNTCASPFRCGEDSSFPLNIFD